jgi:predicted lipoprotein with Yx(FWY)xxD motif
MVNSMRRTGCFLGLLAAAVVIAGCSASDADDAATVRITPPLPATPIGITLINLSQITGVAPPEYLWTRLGDAEGKTLFVSAADQPGVSSCTGECLKQFAPVVADAGAVAFGDWALVQRAEGGQQWAYQGQPLYTFAQEISAKQVDDMLLASERKNRGGGGGGFGRNRVTDPVLEVPEGWTVARFEPEKNVQLSSAFGVRTIAVQDGLGDALVTSQGMTLYGFDGGTRDATKASCAKAKAGDSNCAAKFEPYLAPEVAVATGDLSIVKFGNGGEAGQWAYKGVPLYTFSGDNKPSDAFGVYGDYGAWHVMFFHLDAFPENVQAIQSVGRDKVLADTEGLPLYGRAHFRATFGGATAYRSYMAPHYMGAALRTGGCDLACQKVRRPLLAPADAKSKGHWMVYTREDGTKQWAFQGFALWTYADDKPGFVNGHNVTDYVIGDEGTYKVVDATGGYGAVGVAPGLFWFVYHPEWLGK